MAHVRFAVYVWKHLPRARPNLYLVARLQTLVVQPCRGEAHGLPNLRHGRTLRKLQDEAHAVAPGTALSGLLTAPRHRQLVVGYCIYPHHRVCHKVWVHLAQVGQDLLQVLVGHDVDAVLLGRVRVYWAVQYICGENVGGFVSISRRVLSSPVETHLFL